MKNIKFILKVWSGDNYEGLSEIQFVLNVTNKVLLGGFYNTDLVLYPNREYLLIEPLIFDNASLIIKPGTTLEIGVDKNTKVKILS